MSVTLNNCGFNELDFFQLLAAALVKDAEGDVKLRVEFDKEACSAVTPLLDCDTKDQDPMELLKQMFVIDSCGRVVVKLSVVNLT